MIVGPRKGQCWVLVDIKLFSYSDAVRLYIGTINGLALNGMDRSNRTITELFLKVGQIYAIMGDYKLAELSFMYAWKYFIFTYILL